LPQRAPKDPGAGLGAHEEEAILAQKKRHPSMGPAQIRAQLKRFKGWRVSVRAIARVLKDHGYELVHVASRPKGEEDPERWEAPHRNALWQLDFVELRVGPERRALLLVEDDFSRFCIAHSLFEHPTSEDVVAVLRDAIRRHGKPEAIYTDRGSPFLAWNKPSSLGRFLETELIDHHVSPSYRPQGRGKIESLAATVQRAHSDESEQPFRSMVNTQSGRK
jgi:transposase InsO family protein